MGKYDIGEKLKSDCKLTVYDLAEEIANELRLDDTKSIEMDLGFSKSGLLKKLKDKLNFDAREIAKISEEEQFKMCKLLKELYFIEKYGHPKYVLRYAPEAKTKIRITDILKKPRLSNINTYYSRHSEFGQVFEQLLSDIKLNVDDADDRITIIDTIETYWQNLSQYQYEYVLRDSALENKKEALIELKKINKSLNNILALIDKNNTPPDIQTEGVMETFFDILLTFKKLCYEEDRIRLFNYIDMDLKPNKEYTDLFKKYEETYIDISVLSSLKDLFSWADEHECREDLYSLLSYGEGISKSDYKHYDYAIKHCQTILNWLKREKESMDLSHGVSLVLFLAVIQEFVYIKKHNNDYKIRSDYYGYNSVGDTLISSIKHPEKEPAPAIVDVWIRRIETRFCSNFGVYDLISEKNKAEVTIYKIKKFILSFHNIRFVKVVHDYLFHQAAVSHINCDLVKKSRQIFENKLISILELNGTFIEVLVSEKNSKHVEEMFRELLSVLILESNGEGIILSKLEELAIQVAQHIIEEYNKENDPLKELTHVFPITGLDGSYKNYFLSFKFDKDSQVLIYMQFGIINTEEMAMLSKIGLIQ